MNRRKPVVAVVDAYTSAGYLAPELRALGADLVHVQTTREFMPSMPQPDLSSYQAAFVHEDFDSTVAKLLEFEPLCVIAGQEPGVELADALSERVGGVTNGTALSPARRNKFLMGEALRAAGLHCAEQVRGREIDELLNWSRHRLPVVVKPLRSAAGNHVYICRTLEEVHEAVNSVLSSVTIYGETNVEALVQSYLEGVEYVVDMVSCNRRRYLCGVWAYHRRLLSNGRNVYHRDRLMASDEAPVPELADYTDRVLTALGIEHGATHAEVVVTEQGPALVEVGARIAGNISPRGHDRCAGGNQATLTALSYLDPQKFLAEYAGKRYTRLQYAECLTTSTTRSGLVRAIEEPAVGQLRALPTVFQIDLKLGPGDLMNPTVDLYSSTMRIFQCGPDQAAIDHDRARIEELKDRVYSLAEETR